MGASKIVFLASVFLLLLHPRLALSSPPKIGFILPLTGPAALMGESIQGVAKLARLQNLSPVFEDDRCDAKIALSAYLKLHGDGVHLFYAACSGSILAIAPHLKAHGDLLLTTYAGSSRIRETGNEVIRLNPDAISVAEAAEKLITSDLRPVAILHEEQEYANSLADKLQSLLGKDLAKRISYRPDAPSYAAEILNIKSAKPKSIFLVPVADGAAKIILKQLRQYKLDIPVLGEVNLCDYPFKPSEFGLHGACVSAKFRGKAYDVFIENYTKTLNHPPAYPFYDGMALDLLTFLDRLSSEAITGAESMKLKLLAGFSGQFADYRLTPDGESANAWNYLVVSRY